MTNSIPYEDLKSLENIESAIFSRMNLGLDFSELNILDDVNVSKRKLQDLGVKISVDNPEVAATLLKIAHSIYFNRMSHGEVPDFFSAVILMGAERVKLLLFSVSLFFLDKGPAARKRAAKSASIGILGRLIAEEMNMKDELVQKVETGGLISQLGGNILMKAREMGMDIADDFIQRNQGHLAARIIDRLGLDPSLKQVLDMSSLEFDEYSLTVTGIIKLAEALTEDSFGKYGKLVLRSPMPDNKNTFVKTPGYDIKNLFAALGVEDFLEVKEFLTPRQKEASKKQDKK
jgi:HDOD domain